MLYKFDCSNAALLCWAGELFNHLIFLSTINLESVNKDDSQVTFGEIMVSLFLVIIHQIIIIFTIIMSVNINRERVMLQSNYYSVTHNLQSGPPNLLIGAFYPNHTCKFKFPLAKSWGFIPGGERGGCFRNTRPCLAGSCCPMLD